MVAATKKPKTQSPTIRKKMSGPNRTLSQIGQDPKLDNTSTDNDDEPLDANEATRLRTYYNLWQVIHQQ
jgi:hypothetical protein